MSQNIWIVLWSFHYLRVKLVSAVDAAAWSCYGFGVLLHSTYPPPPVSNSASSVHENHFCVMCESNVLFVCVFFFCRSVVVPVKKTSSGSVAVNTVGSGSSTSGGLTAGGTPSSFAAASTSSKSMINTMGRSSIRLLKYIGTIKILH